MFGVNLRNKFPFYAAIIGSAVAAIFITLNGVLAPAIGIGGLPAFISIIPKSIPMFIVGMIIAVVIPFTLTWLFAKESNRSRRKLNMKDWHKSVVYQIYPKSFNSYYNRETGDIKGVTEKLDYLKELGVDYIWLTPIYQSPQNDNGYDVSDYYSIDPSYGTMEEFEELLAEAKVRNIEIMLDIVVNHSSTEHKWFKEAKEDKNSPYRNYYIWRDEKIIGSLSLVDLLGNMMRRRSNIIYIYLMKHKLI